MNDHLGQGARFTPRRSRALLLKRPGAFLSVLPIATLLVATLASVSAGPASAANTSPGTARVSATTARPPAPAPVSGRAAAPLRMVEMGDSWIEGAHCSCVTFAGLWAEDIQQQTGRPVQLTDLTGVHERSPVESKTSGSLLWALRHDRQTQHVVADSDIVLVSTGGNDLERIGDQLINSTCGGPDGTRCIRGLGHLWERNFDGIAKTIAALRGTKPTAVRFVAEGNFFLGSADLNSLVPEDFALTGGQLMATLYVNANCDAAARHHAKCIDGRPILSGPDLTGTFDENSPSTFRKLTDALDALGLPELTRTCGAKPHIE